ncbi:hypothetical protein RCL1_005884 [Eukaryota sp. TZLM3-RCL]
MSLEFDDIDALVSAPYERKTQSGQRSDSGRHDPLSEVRSLSPPRKRRHNEDRYYDRDDRHDRRSRHSGSYPRHEDSERYRDDYRRPRGYRERSRSPQSPTHSDPFTEYKKLAARLAEEAARTELLARKKEEDLKNRERRSVMINRLHPKVSEDEVYDFFKNKVGNVISVRLIRDRTGKSKGMGYVEFSDENSVMEAVLLNGSPFRGHPVVITESMAERNQQAEDLANQLKAYDEAPSAVYVDKLPRSLDEAQIRELFEGFGPVSEVNLGSPSTTRGTSDRSATAWVHFSSSQAAARAYTAMNGFKIYGSRLYLSYKAPQ